MSIKRYSTYSYQYYERQHYTEHSFPLPFDPESDPEHVYISENGLKAVLAFLVRDDSPEDPFEAYDEGTFIQFNSRYMHDGPRPDVEQFKRIIRDNPGRVFTVGGYSGNYYIKSRALTVADTRNIRPHDNDSAPCSDAIESADGYYIAPDDVTDPVKYADAVLNQYNQWCEGEVYGVIVWTYTRDSIADEWDDPDRDQEVWGYYGYDGYTSDELMSQFEYAIKGNDPSTYKEEF